MKHHISRVVFCVAQIDQPFTKARYVVGNILHQLVQESRSVYTSPITASLHWHVEQRITHPFARLNETILVCPSLVANADRKPRVFLLFPLIARLGLDKGLVNLGRHELHCSPSVRPQIHSSTYLTEVRCCLIDGDRYVISQECDGEAEA